MGHYNESNAGLLNGLDITAAIVNLPPAQPEYSGLVGAMQKRLDEMGLPPNRQLLALMEAEDVLRGPEADAVNWLEEVGYPQSEDDDFEWEAWDDYRNGRV